MVDILLTPWIILFAPLAASVLITLFALKNPKLAAGTAILGILISLAFSAQLFIAHSGHHFEPVETAWEWLSIPGLTMRFGFLLDAVSILMLLIVTGVGSCVFLYSASYMKEDPSYPRYFAYLSLFAFSMLGIVLANNFLMLFVFWELVAVSSYLLIGFWFEKPSAADAGNKAFLVNRVADFGFVLGIFLIWALSGLGSAERTFEFTKLSRTIPALVQSGAISQGLLALAVLLIFCGVVGKSAQFPLYIWLPDAMEGPTPVSALIHAATMVAAGVYLLSRSFFIVGASPEALQAISYIGGITAVLAAMLAVVQNDIKKILAYSTISQLGYMVMAVGLGSANVAMFHLTTHAFFKALLFLGSGVMIHALHTQDIWEMGGLFKKLPVTSVTFLIGTLALCGIYPLSGFFSKDEILLLAHDHAPSLYALGLFTAGLTAFYMTRACWIAILRPEAKPHGKHHSHSHGSHGHEDHSHSHEPMLMKAPLLVLAVLSVIAGFLGIPHLIAGEHGEHLPLNLSVAITSSIVAIGGIAFATLIYGRLSGSEDPLKKRLGRFYDFVSDKYFFDEFALAIGELFQGVLAKILLWFDLNIVMKKGVDGSAGLTAGFASFLRKAQTGRLQTYALVFGAGVLALVWLVLAR